MNLTADGIYVIEFKNMEEIDLVVTLISGFQNCTNNKEFIKSDEMIALHTEAEKHINHLFMNLGGVVLEEEFVDRKRKCKYFFLFFFVFLIDFSPGDDSPESGLWERWRDLSYCCCGLLADFLPEVDA